MPGLVGMVSLGNSNIEPELLLAQRNLICHRPWYQVDDFVNERKTVAVSRVNLGIFNKEQQPYSGRNGRVHIFFHGEIYNDSAAITHPLEFIYQLYENTGRGFVTLLQGSFVVIVVDEDKDLVLIANDRLASKPMFLFNDGKVVYFAPELKSLVVIPSLQRKLNLAAVADFLANGQFTRQHTLVEDIETIDKATVLELTKNGITRHKYWEFEVAEHGRDLGLPYYQDRLASLLRKTVKKYLFSDHTYAVLLSGGYDARGILGCYLEESKREELYTISWGRQEDIPNSDCIIAKRLANKLGAQHRFYQLTAEEIIDHFDNFIWLGEGLTWFPESYEVFHRIKEQQGVDIVLRGDECFGCPWLWVHDEHSMFRTLSYRSLSKIPIYQQILNPDYYELFSQLDEETSKYVSKRSNAKNIHNRKDFFRLDIYQKLFLNPLNYVKTFAIESLNPWLDYEIIDFVSALPLKYRLDKNLYKKTVLKMFPELFEEIAKKDNIIDWASSFKNSPKLQRFVYQTLIEEDNAFNEFLNVAKLKNELDAFFLASPSPEHPITGKNKVKTRAIRTLEKFPVVYNLTHRTFYFANKWLGNSIDPLPTEQLIIRLLILKVWANLFLSYPSVKLPSSK